MRVEKDKKRHEKKSYLLWMMISIIIISTGYAQIVGQTGFEGYSDETNWTQSSWTSEGFSVPWVNGFDQNRAQIDHDVARSGTSSLRVLFPSTGVGPGNSGAQAPLEVTPEDEYYISYWVRFSDNFSWGTTNEGGKLPGLAGGDRCSGCKTCVGDNGFSARLMWRSGGRAVLYLYHMNKSGTCGEDYTLKPGGTDLYFQRGEWYNIVERVKVNSGSNSDGEVELWVNGQQALSVTGLQFVNNGDKVDVLYFSTFHGGSSAGWAPGIDCNIWFDDFVISTNPEDVFVPECDVPNLGANQSICGSTLPVTLDANVSSINRTFQWYKDGNPVGSDDVTFDATSTGVFKVEADSAGCITSDEITISGDIPTPNLGDDITLCDPSIIHLDAGVTGSGLQYQWSKNGSVLLDEDKSTLEVTTPGVYKLDITAAGCTGVNDEITVSSDLLTVTGDEICASGEVNLSASGASNIHWYDALEDGALLSEQSSYSPSISSSTRYYVEDADGFSGTVGEDAPDYAGGYVWNDDRFERKLVFEVHQTINLDSISFWPATANNVTVRVLMNDNTTVLYDTTFSNVVQGEENRVYLGFNDISTGTYYMDFVGTDGELDYSNSNDPNIGYPYTIPDVISITGAEPSWITTQVYYLFAYRWRVSAGNACARTPVDAIINPDGEECSSEPDSDNDGTPDGTDVCPNDPHKASSDGECGCGIEEGTCDDCAGVPNGNAEEDVCGNCSGGTTGMTPVTDPQECIATGIERDPTDRLRVYPNPFTEKIIIQYPGEFQVNVFSLTGVQIFSGQSKDLLEVGASWKPGTYVVELISEDVHQVVKINKSL